MVLGFRVPVLRTWLSGACAAHDRCFESGSNFTACNLAFREDMRRVNNAFVNSVTLAGTGNIMRRIIAKRLWNLITDRLYDVVRFGGEQYYCAEASNADTLTCILYNGGDQLTLGDLGIGGSEQGVDIGSYRVVTSGLTGGNYGVICDVTIYSTFIDGDSKELTSVHDCRLTLD